MNRRMIVIVDTLAVLVLVASVAGESKYAHPQLKFSFEVPDGMIQTKPDGMAVAFEAVDKSLILGISIPSCMPLKKRDTLAYEVVQLETQAAEMDAIGKNCPIQVSTYVPEKMIGARFWISYALIDMMEASIFVAQAYGKHLSYTITLSMGKGTYDKHKQTIWKILKSFTFEE